MRRLDPPGGGGMTGKGPLGDVFGPLVEHHGMTVEVEEVVVRGFKRIGLTFRVDHPEAGKLTLGTFYITNDEARKLGDQLERAVKT